VVLPANHLPRSQLCEAVLLLPAASRATLPGQFRAENDAHSTDDQLDGLEFKGATSATAAAAPAAAHDENAGKGDDALTAIPATTSGHAAWLLPSACRALACWIPPM
jgi:hypothetical protein